MKRLVELYGDVIFLHCDHLAPQVIQGLDGIRSIRRIRGNVNATIDNFKKIVPEADFIVANKFLKDHRGRSNFFVPLSPCGESEADLKYERYTKQFKKDFKKEFGSYPPIDMIRDMNSETNYYADWNRYGIAASYDDVKIPIHGYTSKRNETEVSSLGRYVIVHDSRLGCAPPYVKEWDRAKWMDLCARLSGGEVKVVQFVSPGQKLFDDSIIPHSDVIGRDAMFQDYLYLLSRSELYIGTDSWPAHAAIFTRDPKYTILKGAVSKRWDHGSLFSNILRKGSCQACEGPPSAARSCLWGVDASCMKEISVNDVMESIDV